MPLPTGDPQVLVSHAGIALKQWACPGRAGDDLACAWRHLGAASAGRTVAEQLAASGSTATLAAVLGQNDPVAAQSGSTLSTR